MRRVKKSQLWRLRCLFHKVAICTRGVQKSPYGWCKTSDFEVSQAIDKYGISYERCLKKLTWSIHVCRSCCFRHHLTSVDFVRDVSRKLAPGIVRNVRFVAVVAPLAVSEICEYVWEVSRKPGWLSFTLLNLSLRCRPRKVVVFMRRASKSWCVALWVCAFLTSAIMPQSKKLLERC